MTNWLKRLACCIPLLVLLAYVVKYNLIEPYRVIQIDFDVLDDEAPMKKGDREI